jgi:two-component system sensor histidine kinase VanS
MTAASGRTNRTTGRRSRVRRSFTPTARARLTALYFALLLTAGSALIIVQYVLFRERTLRATDLFSVNVRAPYMGLPPSGPASVTVPGQSAGLPPASATELAVTIRNTELRNLLLDSLVILGVVMLLALVAGWWLSGRVLRPVHQLTIAARTASDGQLDRRLNLTGPHDELKELADTFDHMLDRLQASFEAERRFVANASHELRSPLTLIDTAVQVTLHNDHPDEAAWRSMADDVRSGTRRANHLIADLLTLARSQQPSRDADLVDLAELASDALESQHHVVASRKLRVTPDLQSAPATGTESLLRRMIENLVENAIAHNTEGGWLKIRATTEPEGATLRVTNSGRLPPGEDIDRLLNPFTRAGADRVAESGTGLGLSIVTAVVNAHQGRFSVHANDDGGLDIEVALPARHNPAAAAKQD